MTGIERPAPEVRLYRNPWGEILTNDVVKCALENAAREMERALVEAIAAGSVESGEGALYACVILDPTKPRWQLSPVDRAMAAILLGPDAESCLPHALAKADAADRHGACNGALVNSASHCLGDGEFAWGDSAIYYVEDADGNKVAAGHAGGSGLTVTQDKWLAEAAMSQFFPVIDAARDEWIAEQRRTKPEGHGWYGRDNKPRPEYMAILGLPTND